MQDKNISIKYWCIFISISLSIPGLYLMRSSNYSSGLTYLSLVLGLFIAFLCIYDFKIGLYITTLLGFSIFTLNRLIQTDIPWGLLIEILTLVTAVGLFTSHKIKNINLRNYLNEPITICLIIFFLYSIMNVINPEMNSKLGWLEEIRRQLSLFLYFFIIYTGLRNENEFFHFLKLILILLVCSAVYGCIQQKIGFFNFELEWILKSESRKNLLFMIGGVKRKFSLFSDPSSFGITMAVTSNIFLILTALTKKIKKRFIYLFFAILALLAMAYSGTRTAYIAFILGFAFYLFLTVNKISTIALGIIILFGIIAILYLPIYSNPTLNRIRSAFEISNESSLKVRDKNRTNIQPYIHTHPFGGGLGTSEGRGEKYNPGHALAGFPPDSGFLKTAIELGWIGLALHLFQYFIILKIGISRYFEEKAKENSSKLLLIAIVCVFTYMISQYAQVAVGQFPDSFIFMSAIAILAKSSLNKKTQKQ